MNDVWSVGLWQLHHLRLIGFRPGRLLLVAARHDQEGEELSAGQLMLISVRVGNFSADVDFSLSDDLEKRLPS